MKVTQNESCLSFFSIFIDRNLFQSHNSFRNKLPNRCRLTVSRRKTSSFLTTKSILVYDWANDSQHECPLPWCPVLGDYFWFRTGLCFTFEKHRIKNKFLKAKCQLLANLLSRIKLTFTVWPSAVCASMSVLKFNKTSNNLLAFIELNYWICDRPKRWFKTVMGIGSSNGNHVCSMFIWALGTGHWASSMRQS